MNDEPTPERLVEWAEQFCHLGTVKGQWSSKTPTGHPIAPLLRELAEVAEWHPEPWEEFEVWTDQDGLLNHKQWMKLHEKHQLWKALLKGRPVRRRLRTKRIGEYDVPLPVREALEYGRRYWLADPIHVDLSMESAWRNRDVDTTRLFRGLIHLDPESATIHGKALASLMHA